MLGIENETADRVGSGESGDFDDHLALGPTAEHTVDCRQLVVEANIDDAAVNSDNRSDRIGARWGVHIRSRQAPEVGDVMLLSFSNRLIGMGNMIVELRSPAMFC